MAAPAFTPFAGFCFATGVGTQGAGAIELRCAAFKAVDSGESKPSRGPIEATANFVAHLLAEFLSARRSFLLGDIESIEDVKIFDNRVTIARHGKDA
jgi:hypothetical protein